MQMLCGQIGDWCSLSQAAKKKKKKSAIFQLCKPARVWALRGLLHIDTFHCCSYWCICHAHCPYAGLSRCSPLSCGSIVPLVSWLQAIRCRDSLHCTMWVQSALFSFIKLQQISWFYPNALWTTLKPINYSPDALLNSVYVWDCLFLSVQANGMKCVHTCVRAQYCFC